MRKMIDLYFLAEIVYLSTASYLLKHSFQKDYVVTWIEDDTLKDKK